MLSAGMKAPAFQLRTLDGVEMNLAETLATGPAVLAFFKISCPTCQYALPFLQRMAATDQARLIAISQDDAAGTNEFHLEFGITMPTLLDHKGYAVAKAFEITHVPSIFVIEADGAISKSWMGFSKDDFEELGSRLGVAPFRDGESVLRFKPG